ncbi:hypothetical protein KAJ27_09900, partial [bacterium]|nr:hypothetical protein [bacterium]
IKEDLLPITDTPAPILSDETKTDSHAKVEKIEKKTTRKIVERKSNSRVRIVENKPTGERIVRVETFTMAEIYIKQGLYHEALQILEKLKEKADDTGKIEDTITKVTELIDQDKND